MTTSVSLEHIEVSYGANTVLQSVSADVAGGGWLGILGPNGSRKSSFLKTLVGAV